MTEGRAYLCTWKGTATGFDVWIKSRPKIRASAESFDAADQALYDAILAALGDGENSREYAPPRPDALDHDGLLYRLKRVVGNGRAMIANEDMPRLWSKGVCQDCKKARGKRTRTPIMLRSSDSDDGLLAYAQHMFDYPRLHLYSADFLALLTPAERRRFTWRAVRRPPGARERKEYFEIVGSLTVLRLAAFKEEYVGHNLYVCPRCGYKSEASYSFLPPTPGEYVSERDVPKRLPSCFTISRDPAPEICFTAKRWAQLVGRKGTRGLVSSDVGVVDWRLVDRRPKRQPFEVERWS